MGVHANFSVRDWFKKKNPKFACRIYNCPQITTPDFLSAIPDFWFTAQISLSLLSSDASFVFQPAVKLPPKNWSIKLFNHMANCSLLSLLDLLKLKKMPKCHVNYWYFRQDSQFSWWENLMFCELSLLILCTLRLRRDCLQMFQVPVTALLCPRSSVRLQCSAQRGHCFWTDFVF